MSTSLLERSKFVNEIKYVRLNLDKRDLFDHVRSLFKVLIII